MSDGADTALSLSLKLCLKPWMTFPDPATCVSHLFSAADAELLLHLVPSVQPVKAKVERVGGIEPPSPAWKAGVIAFIRYPHSSEGADSSVLPVSRQCLLFVLELTNTGVW